jgi:hypothetical protein
MTFSLRPLLPIAGLDQITKSCSKSSQNTSLNTETRSPERKSQRAQANQSRANQIEPKLFDESQTKSKCGVSSIQLFPGVRTESELLYMKARACLGDCLKLAFWTRKRGEAFQSGFLVLTPLLLTDIHDHCFSSAPQSFLHNLLS